MKHTDATPPQLLSPDNQVTADTVGGLSTESQSMEAAPQLRLVECEINLVSASHLLAASDSAGDPEPDVLTSRLFARVDVPRMPGGPTLLPSARRVVAEQLAGRCPLTVIKEDCVEVSFAIGRSDAEREQVESVARQLADLLGDCGGLPAIHFIDLGPSFT